MVDYYRLYLAKWGAGQTGAAAYNRLFLPGTAGAWEDVDAHEEWRQADFATLETGGTKYDYFAVDASPNGVKVAFRLYGATSGTIYAVATPTWTAARPYPIFYASLMSVPAADERLQIQFSGYSAMNFLSACWYRWRRS